MKNGNLNKAKLEKNDEFYTQLSDIENELKHYWDHFMGKTILCNCDDPFESNFARYFLMKFNALGLKRLICTCYGESKMAGRQLSVFDDYGKPISEEEARKRKAYCMDITRKDMASFTGEDPIARNDITTDEYRQFIKAHTRRLEGNGDFRSQECIDLLKQADIVVTNPPFSLFREYVTQLMGHDKKFLIIGNENAITYKEIFPLIKDNKVWLGHNHVKCFVKPSGDTQAFGNVCWFTNLDIKKRHEELFLIERYSSERYPKYDNYDAIEVSRVTDIPMDFDGIMGVPVSFVDKYDPDQFDIIGCTANGLVPDRYKLGNLKTYNNPFINGKAVYQRVLIRRR